MKQEGKDLLLRDLCGRLLYGVKCKYDGKVYDILGYAHGRIVLCEPFMSKPECPLFRKSYSNIKLYLFPLSSMTEGQKKEFKEISKCEYEIRDYGGFDSEGVYLIEIGKYEYEYNIDTTVEEFYFNYEIIDWLNKNYFDYRGLIEKGLAIDATGLNIYKEGTK